MLAFATNENAFQVLFLSNRKIEFDVRVRLAEREIETVVRFAGNQTLSSLLDLGDTPSWRPGNTGFVEFLFQLFEIDLGQGPEFPNNSRRL